MQRRTTSWYSHHLNTEMPLVSYGHAGPPLLMFPTAAADYLEYERFYLVDSIKSFIEAGKLRAYSINSVNRYSLLNDQMPPNLKAELLTRYDRYILDEVLPLIRNDCGDGENRPITTGASLGAFLSANAYFKHPDLFRGVIAMMAFLPPISSETFLFKRAAVSPMARPVDVEPVKERTRTPG